MFATGVHDSRVQAVAKCGPWPSLTLRCRCCRRRLLPQLLHLLLQLQLLLLSWPRCSVRTKRRLRCHNAVAATTIAYQLHADLDAVFGLDGPPSQGPWLACRSRCRCRWRCQAAIAPPAAENQGLPPHLGPLQPWPQLNQIDNAFTRRRSPKGE